MLTFEAFSNMGYLAYTLSDSSRRALLAHFKPQFEKVICHHVTYQFPAKKTDALPPAVHQAHVVGHAEEDGLECLVVEVNGHTKRPDGKLYHITLSLDAKKGKKPVHSNDLLQKHGYKHVTPFPIHLTPEFLQ